MKKLSVILVLCMFFACFAACKSTPAKDTELTEEEIAAQKEKIEQLVQEQKEEIALTKDRVQQVIDSIRGDLWVYAIGINEYSKSIYFPNLVYAVDDAKNICEAFKAQEGIAFKTVNTMIISDADSTKPTRENIIKNMDFFKNAKASDTVVLFFAAHRMIQDDVYYLMTSDSEYDQYDGLKMSTVIKFDDIVKNLNVPGKKVIIVDTHYPESAFKSAKEKDIAVLVACKDNEQARESAQFGGGFFTTSIIEAFDNIETETGIITLGALYDFITGRVGEMSENKQTPDLYSSCEIKNMVMGFSIAELKRNVSRKVEEAKQAAN